MKYKLFAKIIKPLILTGVIFGSFFVSNFVFATATVNLSAGLVGHYKMNDNAGDGAVLDSALNHNGTANFNTTNNSVAGVSANTTPVSGHGALSFNGSGEYIDTAFDPSVSLGSTFSISSWVYPTASGNYRGVAGAHSMDGVIGGIVFAQYVDGSWGCGYGGNGAYGNGTTFNLELNTWSLVTCVWNASNGGYTKAYINGSLASETAETVDIYQRDKFWIGRAFDSAERYFQGKIDDFRIYNRAINTDEITALYNSAHGTEARGVGDLTGGLLGHFKLNDNSGDTNVVNSNGDDNGTATFNTADNSVAGVSASTTPVSSHGALSLNGSSDFINVGNSFGSFDDGFKPFSLSAWVKLNSPAVDSYNVIMSKQGNVWCAAPGYSFGIQNGKLMGWIWHHACNGQTIQVSSTNSVVSNATWAYVTMTYSGSGTASGLKFYVNDQLVPMDVTTDGLAGLDIASTYPFQIGNMGDTDWQFPFKGTIDDARVYNRVLNADEIYTLYNGGAGTQTGDMPSGQLAHYKMNDTSGTSVEDSFGSNNGTATQDTSVMTTVGKINTALDFIGANSTEVNISSNFGISTASDWAVSFWAYVPSLVNSGAMIKTGSGSDGISIGMGTTLDPPTANAGLNILYEYVAWYDTGYDFTEIGWHLITMSSLSGNLSVYVDDTSVYTNSGNNFNNPSQSTQIGGNTNAGFDRHYTGAIDDVRFFNKALDQSEIDLLWNGGAGTEGDQVGGGSDPIVTTKYWVGNYGNWSDPANWSASSGGSGGVAAPIAGDTVIFDGGNSGSCYIDVNTTVDNIQIQDGYYGNIYQNSNIIITTTNDITQGTNTGAFYGGYYGTLSTGGNVTFYNFYSYYTNISASGSVSISDNYGEIHLNNLYAGNGTSLHTNYGSVYVNDWNSWGMYDSVYAGAYVDVRSSYSISLYSVYSGQGVNMSSAYGNINVNDWYSSGYYNSVYAPSGYAGISSYGNSISLYSVYSGQGTYLSSYYGDVNVQIFDGSGYYNQVSSSYGSVNLANPYGNIYLYSLSAGYNATLTPAGTVYENYSFSVMGTLYMSGSFYNGGYGVSGNVEFTGTGDSYISGNTPFYGNFTCNQPSKHLYFANGYTQTIYGEFHIAGDASYPVYLMSQSVGNQWYIDPQSTRSVNYAWVQDSNNVNATSIDQTNSTDGGNNTNWTFVTVPTCVVSPDDPLYTLCTYTKSDTFVVPTGVTTAQVYAWGAGGGGGTAGGWSYGAPGGAGGAARGTVTLNPGSSYPIVVGGNGVVNSASSAEGGGGPGSNGSDNRYGGGGGGYSGLFLDSASQENAIIIAGGGGGGASSRAGEGNAGGAGGGASGQVGYSPYDGKSSYGGNPGTQSAAGSAPSDQCMNSGGGQGALQGGIPYCNSYGGGGGGGYFGGSGGGYSESNTMGGGGGGSGYYNPSSVSSAVLTTGSGTTPGDSTNAFRGTAGNAGAVATNGSDGSVVIRYLTPLGYGLVAHYKMNDNLSTANVIENKGGNDGTATQNTSVMHTVGKIGGALVFNGTSDKISLGSNFGLGGTSNVTVSVWIKQNPVTTNVFGIFTDTTDNSNDFYLLGIGDGFYFGNDAGSTFTGVVNYSGWHHLVGTYDGSYMRLYYDGIAVGTPYATSVAITSENFVLGLDRGWSSLNRWFSGSMDDVRIYNRALSSADVAALYNWGDGTEDDGSAAITISGTGTQIATTTIPVTGQNLGGAFLLTSTINNATTTSVRLKNTGSLSTSTISNIVLTYKNAVGGQCSSTKPLGTTSFGTAGSFDASGFATTTGTMPLNQDIPVCIYINYDLTGTFSTSSLGSSIDFEIVNPSADVITTGGIVSTSNSVGIPSQTIVVNDASENPDANPTSCTNSGITSLLSLKMKDPAKNPTVFYLENCAVWKIVGGGTPVRLTNPNLQVHSLDFTNLTGANSGGSVRINMSMSNVDASSTPSYINTSKTYSTTATVKSWGGN